MGYWEEKRKYEELQRTKEADTCTFCGRKGKMKASCQYYKKTSWWAGGVSFPACGKENLSTGELESSLCNACSKNCKNCGKYYCPKHKAKHNC